VFFIAFFQVSVFKRFAKAAEPEVWQGRWLGSLAGSRRRRKKQELCVLVEVRHSAVKMGTPGGRRVANDGELQDVASF